MANIDDLTIKISASSQGASKSINTLIKALNNLNKACSITDISKIKDQLSEFNTTINVTENITRNTTTSITKLSGAAGTLWVTLKKFASFTMLISLLKQGIAYSTDYTETMNYFNVTMKQYTQEALDFATTVNSKMGIDTEGWMNSQATIMSLATTFGIGGEKADVMSQQLTQLAYDLRSLKNVDIETALQKIRSGFAGEIEPLRAWGIDLSKANLMLAAQELGITKSFEAMNQAEKAQLRYYVIMTQTTDAQGDMGKTIGTLANQLMIMKERFIQLARAIGNVFTPALQVIVPIINNVISVLTIIFEKIASLFNFKYPEIQDTGEYAEGMNDYADSMDKATGKAKKLKKQLAGFDEINNLTSNQGSGSGSSASGSWANFELPTYNFLEKLNEGASELKAKLAPLLGLLTGFLAFFVSLKFPVILEKVKNLISNIAGGVGGLFGLIKTNPIPFIIGAIVGLITWLVTLYKNNEDFRNKVNKIWANIKDTFKTTWDAIVTYMSNLITGLKTSFSEIKTKVVDPILIPIIEMIKDLWESDLVQGIIQSLTPLINGVKKVFGGITKFLSGVFTADLGKAIDGIKDIFKVLNDFALGFAKGMFNGVISLVEKGINFLIKGINKFIGKLSDGVITMLQFFGYKGGGISAIKTVSLPRLANGGIVRQPTTAMIGENGAEAVVPLERNTQWINRVAKQMDEHSGNTENVEKLLEQLIETVQNKELTVDGNSLSRQVAKNITKQSRLLGEGLL